VNRRSHSRDETALTLIRWSAMWNTMLGFTYYFARDYEHALEQYNSTLHLYPTFFIAHARYRVALHHAGTLSRSHFRTHAGANAARNGSAKENRRHDLVLRQAVRGTRSWVSGGISNKEDTERISFCFTTLPGVRAHLGERSRKLKSLSRS